MRSVDKNFDLGNPDDCDSSTLVEDLCSSSPTNLLPEDISKFQDDYLHVLFENDSSLRDWDPKLTRICTQAASDSSNDSLRDKSLFDNDEEDDVDLYAWKNKLIEDWDKVDTINWLISTGLKIEHLYSQMSPELAMPGKELLRLSKKDFILIDPNFGEELFNLLHKRNEAMNSLSRLEYSCDDDSSIGGDNVASDMGSVTGMGRGKGRRPRRPRNFEKKVKEHRLRLWEFIRNLLHDPNCCPRLVRWEDYEDRTFRFVKGTEVAKLWGERNPGNTKSKKMTYENLTRAMRYWYTKGMFVAIPGRKRLVYKFGKNATGLETDSPNFDCNYYRNAKSL